MNGAPPDGSTRKSSTPPPSPTARVLGGRYALRAYLDGGGYGAVWLADDQNLQREVVVKIVSAADDATQRAYLAQPPVEALLRHPWIVPVLDRGVEAGQIWMVMERVDGETFERLVERLHGEGAAKTQPTRPSPTARPAESAAPVALRPRGEQAVEAWLAAIADALALLVRAARAVGVAHRNHTVHRDIKPDNLMFEDRPDGPIPRVIDWGLALTLPPPGASEDATGAPPLHPVTGSVGVPDYLAPERILGRPDGDRPTADVYALGAVLYRLLGGRRPRNGLGMEAARRRVQRDPRASPLDAPLIEERAPEWIAVCQQAMDPDPARRPPDADAFADALETAMLRTRLRQNRAHLERARALEVDAERGRETARQALAKLRAWEGVAARAPSWRLEGEAARRADAALDAEARWRRGVDEILRARPWLPEAHLELAEQHARALRAAEHAADWLMARRLRDALSAACDAVRKALTRAADGLPYDPSADPTVPDRLARCQAVLGGRATVTLHTHPSGAPVELISYEDRLRIVCPSSPQPLGETPIDAHAVTRPVIEGADALHRVQPGRMAIIIRAADTTVVYPIHVLPGEHWDGRPPGASAPAPVPLPPAGALRADECYVPAGWAWVGGDPRAIYAISKRRIWVGGFVMKRDPVTHAEYLTFLNDLVDRGLADDAARHAPRKISSDDGDRRFEYARGHDGRYHVLDTNPDAPVCLIPWLSARRYAAWAAGRDDRPWRLPSEWEYEKAARGGDGRRLPWGDHMEAFRSRLVAAVPGPSSPASIDTETDDVSPYGIRWLAGNMRTWCLEAWDHPLPTDGGRIIVPRVGPSEPDRPRLMRGGSWASPAQTTSAASRFADPPTTRLITCGIRLVYGCDRGWDPLTGRPNDEND